MIRFFIQIIPNCFRVFLYGFACFLQFLPPWQIPALLKACTCIVALENENSPTLSYHVPAVPAEAMATGRCVLMSEELHEKEPYNRLVNGKEVLVIKVDPDKIKTTLEKIIKDPSFATALGENSYGAVSRNNSLQNIYDETVEIYKSVLAH